MFAAKRSILPAPSQIPANKRESLYVPSTMPRPTGVQSSSIPIIHRQSFGALMAIPREVRTKFYGLRALALVLMLCAAAMFMFRPHDFAFRSLAILAIFLGLGIVKISDSVARRAQGQVAPERSFEGSFAKEAERPSPLAWTLSAASLFACGVCLYLVHLDDLHGGQEGWPVYALFVAILALILSAGYVVMTRFGTWR